MAVEEVLVLERSDFDRTGSFQGISFDVARYVDMLFEAGALRFIPRPDAEEDPQYKQIIPYVLISYGGRFLTYMRGKRSGEKRLVGYRSIGIGGHINPSDDLPLFNASYRQAYAAAVEREVREEIVLESNHTDRIVAVLNDDSTEVGKVHLGIVHHWILDTPDVRKREQVITQFTFSTIEELVETSHTLESWSQYCLDYISGQQTRPYSVSCCIGPEVK